MDPQYNTKRLIFFSCNKEGWTSNAHAKKWLIEDFEPNTHDKADGRTRLLIFNGHGSHTTADVIRYWILNCIQLALLLLHSLHLTQCLDIGVFSSRKAQMTWEIDCIIQTGISRIQKIEWLDAFITARKLAFTMQNILSSWSGTGLYPFNPQKVLRCIPLPPSIKVIIREPTSEVTNPLDNPELNSSPIETPAMKAANTHIKRHAHSHSSQFDTPTRKHIVWVVSTLNRSLAKNRVQAARPGIKPSKPSGGSARARLGGLHAQFGLLGGVTLSLGLGSAELNRAARLLALGGVRAAECATAHPWLLIG